MPLIPTRAGQPGRADSEHEDKCRRCGASCHLAVPHDDLAVVFPGLHCRYLSRESDGRFSCTVYPTRFEVAPWCHHADVAVPQGFMATDCPYAMEQGVTDGKSVLSEPELERIWPELLARVRAWGVPSFVGREALLREVTRREGTAWELVPWPGDPERLLLRPADAI